MTDINNFFKPKKTITLSKQERLLLKKIAELNKDIFLVQKNKQNLDKERQDVSVTITSTNSAVEKIKVDAMLGKNSSIDEIQIFEQKILDCKNRMIEVDAMLSALNNRQTMLLKEHKNTNVALLNLI